MSKVKKFTVEYETKTVNGRKYMVCMNSSSQSKYYENRICGNWERIADHDVQAVLCWRCLASKLGMPKAPSEKVKSTKPQGWAFLAEFVDVDGKVYHKGIEQPELKGTLPPTKRKTKAKKLKTASKRKQVKLERDEMLAELSKLKILYKKETAPRLKKKLERQVNALSKKINKL